MLRMCCAHLAGQGLTLIPEPLGRGAPDCWSPPPCWLLQTPDLLSTQTHRPLPQENTTSAHKPQSGMQIQCMKPSYSTNLCQYRMKSFYVQKSHTGLVSSSAQIQTDYERQEGSMTPNNRKTRNISTRMQRAQRLVFVRQYGITHLSHTQVETE